MCWQLLVSFEHNFLRLSGFFDKGGKPKVVYLRRQPPSVVPFVGACFRTFDVFGKDIKMHQNALRFMPIHPCAWPLPGPGLGPAPSLPGSFTVFGSWPFIWPWAFYLALYLGPFIWSIAPGYDTVGSSARCHVRF